MAKQHDVKSTNIGIGMGSMQTFSLAAPAAMNVQLVGDFTNWQEHPIQMQKTMDGIWRTTLPLEVGLHQYHFLVDGQWREDPECSIHLPNPDGSEDSVRQVK